MRKLPTLVVCNIAMCMCVRVKARAHHITARKITFHGTGFVLTQTAAGYISLFSTLLHTYVLVYMAANIII